MKSLFKKTEKIQSGLKAGDLHYRAFIGPPERYDLVSSMQFNLITKYGLRETHKFLDIGCGSLRGGRLFIIYLLEGNYYGVEPEKWLVDDGIYFELGKQLIKMKKPSFLYRTDFDFSKFNQTFDFALAQSIFTHSSEYQIRQCISALSSVANHNFTFLASFIEGNTNYMGKDWVYPNCVQYKFEFLKSIIEEYGFKCVKTDDAHPNGHTWMLITK